VLALVLIHNMVVHQVIQDIRTKSKSKIYDEQIKLNNIVIICKCLFVCLCVLSFSFLNIYYDDIVAFLFIYVDVVAHTIHPIYLFRQTENEPNIPLAEPFIYITRDFHGHKIKLDYPFTSIHFILIFFVCC
jgi:hypothetical protein